MMSAIIGMAERLQLGTVAEGVETPGELAKLKTLGCGNVQGIALARPMPPKEVTGWLRNRVSGSRAKPGVDGIAL